MKISTQWLKEILPGLKATPKLIAQRLSDVGFEIEGIEDKASHIPGLVIGEVLSKEKHPQADRLSLCQVNTGKENYQVVCGAPNVAVGKKYPFATIGTTLPNGLTLKQTAIRGMDSFGMLCSAKELGLSEESTGLYELDDSAVTGRGFSKIYGDVVLDIAVPPNRGDALSHWGIAREVAALFGLTFKLPASTKIKGTFSFRDSLKISLNDKKGCLRYTSRVIRNVKISPSPFWLAHRLALLGIRSINNVVDATNIVMMETGHPLHAFDHRFLRGGKLEIRKAGVSQNFETLDAVVRQLEVDDLVIADAEGPVALAGIMGGKNSEVKEATSILVLEAASFDPVKIRKTAKRLALHSESSHRFERGVDAATVREALDRLTSLILEIAGGEASHDIVDLYPQKRKTQKIILRTARLDQIVGEKISPTDVKGVLSRLGMTVAKSVKGFSVTIPTFRADLSREIDLIEEVVRYRGFEKIKSTLPPTLHRPLIESPESFYEEEIRRFFSARGFSETIHYSFCSPVELEKLGVKDFFSLTNPLSPELSVLRPSLLPSLLGDCRLLKTNEGVSLFELRTVYTPPNLEQKRLTGVYGGKNMDFFVGKGLLESLFKDGKIPVWKWKRTSEKSEFHPAQCVEIILNDKVLGYFGRLHPQLAPQPLYAFDLDYSVLARVWKSNDISFKPLSPFPSIVRDMALVADRELSFETLVQTIRDSQVLLLKDISLFDVYEGDKIAADKKSLAFSLVYADPTRTLTDEEVNKVHFALVKNLCDKLGVSLRE